MGRKGSVGKELKYGDHERKEVMKKVLLKDVRRERKRRDFAKGSIHFLFFFSEKLKKIKVKTLPGNIRYLLF